MSRTNTKFRIGLAIPLRGPAGMFAPSCEAAAALAVAQINDEGGICGQEVVIETIDAGDTPERVASNVRLAIANDRIDAVTGWHISAVCQSIGRVAQGHIPYVYPVLYEGGGLGRGVVCTGEVPQQQVMPALRWFEQHKGYRRWAIVGDDYIWPRATARHVRTFCHELGLRVVEEIFVRYGHYDVSAVVQRIARSHVEAVLMLMVGQDAVLFNREFSRLGLHTSVARFSPLMDETMLLASGPEATENLFASAGYFTSLATASAMDLMDAYVGMYGPQAPALNNQAEACLEGIKFLQTLHRASNSADVEKVMTVTECAGYDGPRGAVSVQDGVCHQQVHLAEADGVDFDVIETLVGAT